MLLMDVMFDGAVFEYLLHAQVFEQQWHRESHSLSVQQLNALLASMETRNLIVKSSRMRGQVSCATYALTPSGGELWSVERQPLWDLYCSFYFCQHRERRRITCVSSNPKTCQACLEVVASDRTNARIVTNLQNVKLIYWKQFSSYTVGVTFERDLDEEASFLERRQRIQKSQFFWSSLRDLQKFKNVVTETPTSELEK